MKRIVVPTRSPEDWKRLLAKPDLHWKAGCSAMALARSWEDAQPSVPPEIAAALESADDPSLGGLRLLLAIPEYQVELPGGQRPSQTDVLALMRGQEGLVVVAVEGKVDEPFGPTVGEKRSEASAGVDERLAWLIARLGFDSVPDTIRYQLLHRTVSSLSSFNAACAVMLVHSFSPTGRWFEDFAAFASLFGVEAGAGSILRINRPAGVPLFIGWRASDQRFRERV